MAFLLDACGDRSVPSAEENRQLDNAEQLLNSAPDALANVDENALGDAERNSVDEPR